MSSTDREETILQFYTLFHFYESLIFRFAYSPFCLVHAIQAGPLASTAHGLFL